MSEDRPGVVERASDTPATLNWPPGVDTAAFLRDYWQRQPVLIRQGLAFADNPVDPDELAGLAMEADVASRLILFDDGVCTVEHGPFEAARFEALGARGWSLLVSDVEKHLPELRRWLRAFRFLPGWRFDDLMISHAPDGASVGAHVDDYDVFLLQVSGRRRWSIDRRAGAAQRQIDGAPLRLLADFVASDCWTLVPGDLLYLPPGVPHHGIAEGDDCMTWSIGYRAPLNTDILAEFTALLLEELRPERYRDPPLPALAPAQYGEIDAAVMAAVHTRWQQSTRLSPGALCRLTGRLLTRPLADRGAGLWQSAAQRLPAQLAVNAFSRVAYCVDATLGDSARVRFFADGEDFLCSAALAQRLCDPESRLEVAALSDAHDRQLVTRLFERGILESVIP